MMNLIDAIGMVVGVDNGIVVNYGWAWQGYCGELWWGLARVLWLGLAMVLWLNLVNDDKVDVDEDQFGPF